MVTERQIISSRGKSAVEMARFEHTVVVDRPNGPLAPTDD